MSSVRRLPLAALARMESHLGHPQPRAGLSTRHSLVSRAPASLDLVSRACDSAAQIRIMRQALIDNRHDLSGRTHAAAHSAALSSIRHSLETNDSRTATRDSLTLISSVLSAPSSSTSTSAHHKVLDDLFDIYLAKIEFAGSLQRLLQMTNDPSLVPPTSAIKLARASLRHRLVYQKIFYRTFGMVDYPDRDRHPVLHRLVSSLLRQGVPRGSIADFYLEERARWEKMRPGSTRKWELEIWSKVMPGLDYQHALTWLKSFQQAVQSRCAADLESASATDIEPIIEPYRAFLRIWSDTRLSDEAATHRSTPATMVRDLIDLIGRKCQLPTSFLNVWMNAERIAQNYDNVSAIWKLFYHADHLSSFREPESHHDLPTRARPTPDDGSWIIYLKAQRSVRFGQDSASFRADIRELLKTFRTNRLTTKTLNQVVATLCHTSPPDLPLLLCVLRLYDWDPSHLHGPPPDHRTIDVVAAGLVRLWYSTGRSLDQLFIPHVARDVRDMTSRLKRQKASIFRREWELVTETLRQLIPPDEEALFTTEQLTLPIGKDGIDLATTDSTILIDDVDEMDFDKAVETPGQITPAHVLLRPLLALVSNAIRLVLSKRIHSDSGINQAYDTILERVYEDIMPNQKTGLKIEDDWERVYGEKSTEGDGESEES